GPPRLSSSPFDPKRFLPMYGRQIIGERGPRARLRLCLCCGLSSTPDVQHTFPKAPDELIGYVRRQNLAEIIKRPAHHGGKLVRRSMLCPTATQLQTSLPICLCVHRPGCPAINRP